MKKGQSAPICFASWHIASSPRPISNSSLSIVIVSSGTRLDLNYYIQDNIDEYHQEDILDYFREAESDNVEQALRELGEDEYEEQEVRLMRIKFISEVGN